MWQNWPKSVEEQQHFSLRRALLLLCFSGLLLAICYWLWYPLVEKLPGGSLLPAFSWLPDLYWTTRLPFLVAALSRVPWLNPISSSPTTSANLFLLVLGIAFALFCLAGRVCQGLRHEPVRREQMRLLLVLCGIFTLLFGMLVAFLPASASSDTLLYGLYGRMILFYHLNPYLASAAQVSQDPLYHALPPGSFASPLTGPLWLDLTVPVAWLAQANPGLVVLGFRLFGLLLHLANACLIWAILAKLKPGVRLTGTLLYAWNPAILLLGVGEMHADMAMIFFVLLGTLFLLRRALLVSWICLLLAALINPFCLLLLPLFLRILMKELQAQPRVQRVLWWFCLLLFSALLVALAYTPYWRGLGLAGLALRLGEVFWPQTTQHSLLTAFAQLPFASWPPVAWLLTPLHWLILPVLAIGLILLTGIWMVDNLEMVLLFGCWIFLTLTILWPISSPWLILLPLALSLARFSRRTALMAHLLTLGSLVAYYLSIASQQWNGQALVTIGLPMLIWGWAIFFFSTWQMTHREAEQPAAQLPAPKKVGISRPPWSSQRIQQ